MLMLLAMQFLHLSLFLSLLPATDVTPETVGSVFMSFCFLRSHLFRLRLFFEIAPSLLFCRIIVLAFWSLSAQSFLFPLVHFSPGAAGKNHPQLGGLQQHRFSISPFWRPEV